MKVSISKFSFKVNCREKTLFRLSLSITGLVCALSYSLPAQADTFRLKNGKKIEGRVLKHTDTTISIRTDEGGNVDIARDDLLYSNAGAAISDSAPEPTEGGRTAPDTAPVTVEPAPKLAVIEPTPPGAIAQVVVPAPKPIESKPAISYKNLKMKVHGLLTKKKYQELNDLLESLQKAAEADIRREHDLRRAYGGFELTDASLERNFDEWGAFFPNSDIPFAAKGVFACHLAWEARSYAFADETPEEQKILMVKMFSVAQPNLERALKTNPKNIVAYSLLFSLGYAMSASDEWNARVMAGVDKNVPQSFLIRRSRMLGLRPRWGGSFEQMDAFAAESQKYADQNPEIKYLNGFSAMDEGSIAFLDKKYDQALSALGAAIVAWDYWEFYECRGGVYIELKDTENALADFNKAIELDPDNESLYASRAALQFSLGNKEEAKKDIETAQNLWPFNENVRHAEKWLGSTLVYQGYEQPSDPTAQKEMYAAAIQVNPNSADAYYYLGYQQMKEGQLDEGLMNLDKAIALEPARVDFYAAADYILTKQKKWKEASERWTKFIHENPADPEGYMQRGGAYYHGWNWPAAIQDSKKACELGNSMGCMQHKRLARRMALLGGSVGVLLLAIIAKIFLGIQRALLSRKMPGVNQ